jgi:hypothetical protein
MTVFMCTAGFNTMALLLWGNDNTATWVKVALAWWATLGWAQVFTLLLT